MHCSRRWIDLGKRHELGIILKWRDFKKKRQPPGLDLAMAGRPSRQPEGSRSADTKELTFTHIMEHRSTPLYYGSYLKIPELLSLQSPRSPAHEEMLFITTHQAYEIWFKQILHEFEGVRNMFEGKVNERDMGVVVSRLERVREIMGLLIQQIDVLETMSPLDFLVRLCVRKSRCGYSFILPFCFLRHFPLRLPSEL